MEKWKDIPWYKWYYQASNLWNIRSVDRKVFNKSFWWYQHLRWKQLKQGFHKKSGYNYLVLSNKGVLKTFRVHRLLALTFIPNPKNKPQVNHKDWIKTNNKLENLEWCTKSENMKHSFKMWLSKSNLIGKNTWVSRKERAIKNKFIL